MWTDVPLILAQGGSEGFNPGDSGGGNAAGGNNAGGNNAAGNTQGTSGTTSTSLQPASNNSNNQNSTSIWDNQFFFIMILVLGAFLLFTVFSSRKEKKKRQQLLSSIGKGDKVQTIGGILGTVMDIKGDEVVLKVDESTNAKMRFSRSAVQNVLSSKSAKAEGDSKSKDEDSRDEK